MKRENRSVSNARALLGFASCSDVPPFKASFRPAWENSCTIVKGRALVSKGGIHGETL